MTTNGAEIMNECQHKQNSLCMYKCKFCHCMHKPICPASGEIEAGVLFIIYHVPGRSRRVFGLHEDEHTVLKRPSVHQFWSFRCPRRPKIFLSNYGDFCAHQKKL